MGILTEKSHFCALSVIFLRLVCILKLEGVLQGYVKWKNSMTIYVNFLRQMSDLKPVCSIKMWKLTEKSHFCALSVIFLRLVCILKLEGVLQGYVKWKNSMTIYVNFLRQNVGSETSLLIKLYGDIDRKITFLCPLRYIFEASVHFKVGRCSSRIC